MSEPSNDKTPSGSIEEAANLAAKLSDKTPEFMRRKIRKKREQNPDKDFSEIYDEVAAEPDFSLFCYDFNCAFESLESEENSRDRNRDIISLIAQGKIRESRQSLFHAVKQELTANVYSAISSKWTPQFLTDYLIIRFAERRAAYVLDRYAPQKIQRVFADEFESGEHDQLYYEEAQRRRLPALTKLIGQFIENNHRNNLTPQKPNKHDGFEPA